MAGTLRAVSRINIRNVVFLIKHRWKTYSTAAEEARSIPQLAKLTDKSILRITGRDSAKFMQGVITHDIFKLKPDGQRSLFAMLLNSQGRILFDAFIYCVPGEIDEYFLECDKSAVDDIIKHLKTYKLRSKVNFEDASKDVEPWVLFGENDCTGIEMVSNENILATKDPRLGHLCIRMIVPWNQSPVDFTRIDEHVVVDAAVYKEHRYKCGIPEGINEISSTKSLPLEYNLALMNGVSFSKGCYIGQELTARTHHTGQIRKRIMPLQLMVEEKIKSYPVFASGSAIKTDSGRSAGSLAVMSGKYGLGLIRLKELSESYFLVVTDVNGKELHAIASKPTWWPGCVQST